MANAPEPYVPTHYDAPEAYGPQQHHVDHNAAPAFPNSPPPQYANNGMQQDSRYSTYKPGFVPVAAPVAMGDSENQAAVIEPTRRLRDRRVCGIPMLWFLALITLLLIGAIVGGVLGGVLGTKNKDPAIAVTEPEPEPEPETPGITTTSSSSSSSATPMPTAVFAPRTDSWYYMKNDLMNPAHAMALELVVYNSTGNATTYFGITEPRGDPYEHWGFWPASRNSTFVEDYRQRQNISSQLYILYNRGLLNLAGVPSPDQATLDDQISWWWFTPHPIAPYMYCKGAWQGPEFAFTIFDNGSGAVGNDDRFDVEWNRTDSETYNTEERKKAVRNGQAWKMELAFAFLEGEKGLWDSPPATATATASP